MIPLANNMSREEVIRHYNPQTDRERFLRSSA